MFCLGKQVGRNEFRIGGLVDQDEYLCWASQKVDADVPVDLAFGLDDKDVARPVTLSTLGTDAVP